MRILLSLSYFGAAYCGFQVQKGQMSVQSTLQDAIEQVYGKRLMVVGCSRTDSGVHARDYKLTFDTDESLPHIPMDRIPYAINRYLPMDIAVTSATAVSSTFHVRHHVVSKEYEYLIWNRPIRNPFYDGRAYHDPIKLDSKRMHSAAQAFLGTHDFAGFSAAGGGTTDTVRTMLCASVDSFDSLVRFRITGNGFLYNMVRIMTGTLIEIATGRLSSDTIQLVLTTGDRKYAGFTAPPQGLYLNCVTLDTEKMGLIEDTNETAE